MAGSTMMSWPEQGAGYMPRRNGATIGIDEFGTHGVILGRHAEEIYIIGGLWNSFRLITFNINSETFTVEEFSEEVKKGGGVYAEAQSTQIGNMVYYASKYNIRSFDVVRKRHGEPIPLPDYVDPINFMYTPLEHFENMLIAPGAFRKNGNMGTHVMLYDLCTREWTKGPELVIGMVRGNFYYRPGVAVDRSEGNVYVVGGAKNPWPSPLKYHQAIQRLNIRKLLRADPGETVEWERLPIQLDEKMRVVVATSVPGKIIVTGEGRAYTQSQIIQMGATGAVEMITAGPNLPYGTWNAKFIYVNGVVYSFGDGWIHSFIEDENGDPLLSFAFDREAWMKLDMDLQSTGIFETVYPECTDIGTADQNVPSTTDCQTIPVAHFDDCSDPLSFQKRMNLQSVIFYHSEEEFCSVAPGASFSYHIKKCNASSTKGVSGKELVIMTTVHSRAKCLWLQSKVKNYIENNTLESICLELPLNSPSKHGVLTIATSYTEFKKAAYYRSLPKNELAEKIMGELITVTEVEIMINLQGVQSVQSGSTIIEYFLDVFSEAEANLLESAVTNLKATAQRSEIEIPMENYEPFQFKILSNEITNLTVAGAVTFAPQTPNEITSITNVTDGREVDDDSSPAVLLGFDRNSLIIVGAVVAGLLLIVVGFVIWYLNKKSKRKGDANRIESKDDNRSESKGDNWSASSDDSWSDDSWTQDESIALRNVVEMK